MRLTLIKVVLTIFIMCVMGALSQAITGNRTGRPGPMPFILSIATIAAIIGVWKYKPKQDNLPGDKEQLNKNR